jgi:outer membrane assembly lipoprotein YfiO
MRKIIIPFFCILFLFSSSAYPFWIWSPKTQKWKNPKYSALATPYLQFKEGEKYFGEKKYKEAYDAFKKLIIHYPDAQEAAEAQYYLGMCLEQLEQPYQAFLEYQKVIDSYPNSKRINEVVERQYKIGEYFLNREPKQWLGVSLYDFVEHPSIEIFKKIVEKVPYSSYATLAEYKLGLLFLQLGRYDEARDAFQKVIDDYPESEWAMPAKYQLAIATAKASPGIGYDSTSLEEASARLNEFIKKHPDAQISAQAEEQLKGIRNREAKKNFDIAQFYEKQEKYDSALTYYKIVINNYADSGYYLSSLERIKELSELVEGKITKKELIKRNQQALEEEKQKERWQLQEKKYLQKEQRTIQTIEKKKSIVEQKKQKKQKEIEKKKAVAEQKTKLKEKRTMRKKALKKAKPEQKQKNEETAEKSFKEEAKDVSQPPEAQKTPAQVPPADTLPSPSEGNNTETLRADEVK